MPVGLFDVKAFLLAIVGIETAELILHEFSMSFSFPFSFLHGSKSIAVGRLVFGWVTSSEWLTVRVVDIVQASMELLSVSILANFLHLMCIVGFV